MNIYSDKMENLNNQEKKVEEIKELHEKDELIQQKNISLIIDTYDDIFSDFDPRPYDERALSDDFLEECRKFIRHSKGNEKRFELRIQIPKSLRDINDESKIRKRLREYFKRRYSEKLDEVKKIKRTGIVWGVIGVTVLTIIILIILNFEEKKVTSLLSVLEVPCWFLIWEGMGKIFLTSKDKQPELDFLRKMCGLNIGFLSY